MPSADGGQELIERTRMQAPPTRGFQRWARSGSSRSIHVADSATASTEGSAAAGRCFGENRKGLLDLLVTTFDAYKTVHVLAAVVWVGATA